MKRFHSRFEALRKMRKMHEERALRDLASAQRSHQDALDEKAGLLEAQKIARQSTLLPNVGGASGGELKVEDQYWVGLGVRIEWSDRKIVRAKKSLEKAMQKYLGRRKDLRIAEKLQENERAEFVQMQRHQEAKKFDELYILRAGIQRAAELNGSNESNEGSENS